MMNKCPKCGRYVDPNTQPDILFCDGRCEEKKTRHADVIDTRKATWFDDLVKTFDTESQTFKERQ